MLEQHHTLGGLTQTFNREGYTFNTGVHYIGDVGPHGQSGHILNWLADGGIEMASMGPVYDVVHMPGGFQVAFSRPEAALKLDLKEKFPDAAVEIERFFAALTDAQQAAQSVYAMRAMPEALAHVYHFWRGRAIQRWSGRTTQQVLQELITDERLRGVLAAQCGDYGGPPSESSFAMHATVMRHYLDGAYYPVGGAGVFAQQLGAVIKRHGGEIHTRALAQELTMAGDKVTGVRLGDGRVFEAPRVVSDIGALNTVSQLLPPAWRDSAWAREVLAFKPSVAHLGVYLGFEGDIKARGADTSNHWIYEGWEPGEELWTGAADQALAPGMFVAFPSLKDPQHDAGPTLRHTAEIVVLTRGEAFSQWAGSRFGHRPEDYASMKQFVLDRLVAQFLKHFPALRECLRFSDLSTPLTTAHFTHARDGATYGLETTPRRFLSSALNAKTPVAGLYLAGQDVASPGVVGAMMGGILAAASIEPKLFRLLA